MSSYTSEEHKQYCRKKAREYYWKNRDKVRARHRLNNARPEIKERRYQYQLRYRAKRKLLSQAPVSDK